MLVCTAGIMATCGDIQTGSPNVTAGGLGICRGGVDIAGSIIIPFPSNVTVNGAPIVVAGNPITPHGQPPHTAAFTVPTPFAKVFVG